MHWVFWVYIFQSPAGPEAESSVGMVTGISAAGGGEKGKEMRRGEQKKSKETGKAGVSWVLWVSVWNVSLYYPWPPPPCLTLSLTPSLTYYLTLASSSSVFLQSLSLCLWMLFASYSCPLHTNLCVCVCVWWPIPFWDTEMSPQCTISVIVLPCCSGNKDPSCELWFQLQAKL